MKAAHETETPSPTPEELMRLLEVQLASRRSQTASAGRNRAIILVVGLLFIVAAAGAALLVLDQMLADMRNQARSAENPAPVTATNF